MKINHKTSGIARRKVLQKNAGSNKWILFLYVAGHTARSAAALINLKAICKGPLGNKYRIKEIDILKNPRSASEDQILAVPTLLRKFPTSVKMIIGDLSNAEQVIAGLGLK